MITGRQKGCRAPMGRLANRQWGHRGGTAMRTWHRRYTTPPWSRACATDRCSRPRRAVRRPLTPPLKIWPATNGRPYGKVQFCGWGAAVQSRHSGSRECLRQSSRVVKNRLFVWGVILSVSRINWFAVPPRRESGKTGPKWEDTKKRAGACCVIVVPFRGPGVVRRARPNMHAVFVCHIMGALVDMGIRARIAQRPAWDNDTVLTRKRCALREFRTVCFLCSLARAAT